MILNTVIFDMDGLLIDSEPLWHEAANEAMKKLGIELDEKAYAKTVGLRTREFLQFWFHKYNISQSDIPITDEEITNLVVSKVLSEGTLMPGVLDILTFFENKSFRVGLATSSPKILIDAVLERTGLTGRFDAISSAEHLTHGKPHPQVYLDCSTLLKSIPTNCICFEDSFNGMIAAKAARMKCVVVPSKEALTKKGWDAADLKLSSLCDFDEMAFLKLHE